MDIEKWGAWIGAVGGGLGILGAVAGGAAFVLQYFATQERLNTVDCQQYFRTQIIEAQTLQIVYNQVYTTQRSKAASAQIAHQADPDDAEKLEAYRIAVDEQNAALKVINEAKQIVSEANKEVQKCGHRGPKNFT